nr:MAG TPA: hypothetical protein [Caudoviricetes sp.]
MLPHNDTRKRLILGILSANKDGWTALSYKSAYRCQESHECLFFCT